TAAVTSSRHSLNWTRCFPAGVEDSTRSRTGPKIGLPRPPSAEALLEPVLGARLQKPSSTCQLLAACRPQPRGRLNRAAHETQHSPAKMMRAFTTWDISHCCRNSCQCVGITVQLLVAWFAG